MFCKHQKQNLRLFLKIKRLYEGGYLVYIENAKLIPSNILHSHIHVHLPVSENINVHTEGRWTST